MSIITIYLFLFLNSILYAQSIRHYPEGITFLSHLIPTGNFYKNEIYEMNPGTFSYTATPFKYLNPYGNGIWLNNASLRMINCKTDFGQSWSYAFWTYPPQYVGEMRHTTNVYNSTSSFICGFVQLMPYIRFGTNDIIPNIVFSSYTVKSLSWHFICWTMCYTNKKISIYVDGKFVKEQSFVGIIPTMYGNFSIGKTDASYYYTGPFAEVQLYQKCLTSSEVINLYNKYVKGIIIDD